MSDSCLFCKIAAGEIPATKVHQTEAWIAIRDINPQAPTHILVLPRRHLTSVAAAQDGDQELLGSLLLAAADIARREGVMRGYRLVVNTGTDGGQSVDHLHVHLLAGRPLRWPPG